MVLAAAAIVLAAVVVVLVVADLVGDVARWMWFWILVAVLMVSAVVAEWVDAVVVARYLMMGFHWCGCFL